MGRSRDEGRHPAPAENRTMHHLWQWLMRPLWQYTPQTANGLDLLYRWVNLVEGTAWCLIGAAILLRHFRYRRWPLEPLYAATFVLFGISDFREAWCLQPWLILVKAVLLLALWCQRAYVLTRHYPQSRAF
jgi:hypothetical protein